MAASQQHPQTGSVHLLKSHDWGKLGFKNILRVMELLTNDMFLTAVTDSLNDAYNIAADTPQYIRTEGYNPDLKGMNTLPVWAIIHAIAAHAYFGENTDLAYMDYILGPESIASFMEQLEERDQKADEFFTLAMLMANLFWNCGKHFRFIHLAARANKTNLRMHQNNILLAVSRQGKLLDVVMMRAALAQIAKQLRVKTVSFKAEKLNIGDSYDDAEINEYPKIAKLLEALRDPKFLLDAAKKTQEFHINQVGDDVSQSLDYRRLLPVAGNMAGIHAALTFAQILMLKDGVLSLQNANDWGLVKYLQKILDNDLSHSEMLLGALCVNASWNAKLGHTDEVHRLEFVPILPDKSQMEQLGYMHGPAENLLAFLLNLK